MSKLLRVLLADDHEMMREGLRMLVSAQADMEVVGEAADGRAAITMAHELKPDVVVMDISMPELNGLKATERLKKLCPEIKVLTLTRHVDDAYIQQVLKAGATGYVLKQSASVELVRAIRAVAAGHTYLDPVVAGRVVESAVGRRATRSLTPDKDFSPREQEVLRLIAWGYANKEIAARLQLSTRTVEAHKANAMRKMGMTSRIDIVRYALLKGWLQDT
jgi:DNA-binding NarL/FixJ family response regulator